MEWEGKGGWREGERGRDGRVCVRQTLPRKKYHQPTPPPCLTISGLPLLIFLVLLEVGLMLGLCTFASVLEYVRKPPEPVVK